MSFEVLPALDVSGGAPARFQSGQRHLSESGTVAELLDRFVGAGARRLHVVDMDLAFDGDIENAAVVSQAVGSGLSVQAGGGVTTRTEVLTFLDAGADRVVLGSAALKQRDRVERLVAEFGERLVLGLEVDGDLLRPRGRWSDLRLSLSDTLGWLASVPIARVLMTAISRVGERNGPDLAALATVRGGLAVPVLVAGGIASAEQVRLLKDASASGVVVGRAAAEEGGLDLSAALALSEV